MTTAEELLGDLDNEELRTAVTVRLIVGRAVTLVNEWAELEQELATMRLTDEGTLESGLHDLAERVEAKQAEIEAARAEFRFVGIGPKAWKDLVSLHPPTSATLKKDPHAEIDPETFWPAAISASCQSPEFTVEQATQLYASKGMSDGEWDELTAACNRANRSRFATPKSDLAGLILQASETSGSTAVPMGSPDLSSLDGS